MPKKLRQETANEVDDSPLFYNAKDYNIHHREIRAIEQLLVGNVGFSGLVSSTGGANSITDVVEQMQDILRRMANNNLLAQFSGVVSTGNKIIIPPNMVQTATSGALSAATTTITVGTTDHFPDSGYITKFNSVGSRILCTDGNPPGAGDRCDVGATKFVAYASGVAPHISNQEIINYDGKTSTQFLNCTRGAFGTTAQDVAADVAAVVVSGRAALSMGIHYWEQGLGAQLDELYVGHSADLVVTGKALETGSRTREKEIQEVFQAAYMLTISGSFDSLSIEQLFTLGG
jgi:hypothetical protein